MVMSPMMLLLLYCCSIAGASWQEIPWDVSTESTFGEHGGYLQTSPEFRDSPERAVVSRQRVSGTPEEKILILQGMLRFPNHECYPLMNMLFNSAPRPWKYNFYNSMKLRGKLSLCAYEEMKRRFVTEGAAYVPQAAQLNDRCGRSFVQPGPTLKAWLKIVIAPNLHPITVDQKSVAMRPEQFALLLQAEIQRTATVAKLVVTPLAMEA